MFYWTSVSAGDPAEGPRKQRIENETCRATRCGDGRVCRTAVRSFSVSGALGVDINPFLVKEAEALTRDEFPSCCSSSDSSRFHFFELGIPSDGESDTDPSPEGDEGGEHRRATGGKDGVDGATGTSRAEGRNDAVNCGGDNEVGAQNKHDTHIQAETTTERAESDPSSSSLSSLPAPPSARCSAESDFSGLSPEYLSFFQLVRKFRISVIFIYLVPRQTSRMSKFFRLLLRMQGVRIISLRFSLPEGTRQAKNKTVVERCFVPQGDEPEPLFKVYLYSGNHAALE
uniref:Uncharacterized protein n=1 Tax=Neospora caninum (strain Liverpool) TaxID=572307 RepID=A0A0F7UK02_NEOCL|nr:TPA: hypothetical protein BN1204_059915 [Neospora caninum Liverpool]